MSILDDAIREHLELKRAHGADAGELKKLEDEAFGPPQRPDEVDPFAEAPTEFLLAPSDIAADVAEVGDEDVRGGRRPNITDLQEAPLPTPPEGSEAPAGAAPFDADAEDAAPFDAASGLASDEELSPAPDAPPPSPTDAAEVPLPPPADEAPEAPSASEPADEEHPAGEHEIVADADAEERPPIVDQPTQMFDVQAHVDAEAAEAASAEQAPSDEELVDAALSEPSSAPPAPEDPADAGPPTELYEQQPLDTRGPDAEVAGHPPAEPVEEESAEYDFFNEQRLSDELDQALEAPITDEHGLPRYEDSDSAQGGIFDIESQGRKYEDDPSEEVLRRMDEPPAEEAPDAFEPPAEETPRDRAPEPPAEASRPEPPSEEAPRGSAEPPAEGADIDYDPDTGHEDVLEDTPRFLEDAPEDDDLWFEQKPPKDFDLD